MDRYYYHGVGDYISSDIILKMLQIIKSQKLKTRSDVNNIQSSLFNHVCLYKKNEDFDYSDSTELALKSARGGFIDHCFGFILSPSVDAYKAKYIDEHQCHDYSFTNLVDEWRSNGDISFDKVVGIFIPFDSIKEMASTFDDIDNSFFEELDLLIKIANDYDLIVVNSDEKDFTDILDNTLNTSIKK